MRRVTVTGLLAADYLLQPSRVLQPNSFRAGIKAGAIPATTFVCNVTRMRALSLRANRVLYV